MPFDGAEFFPPSSGCVAGTSWSRLRSLLKPAQPRQVPLGQPVPREAGSAALSVLATARRMIENERDWVQGTYSTLGGKHCAVGALNEAAWRLDALAALPFAHNMLLDVATARGFRNVESMNDRSLHQEVLAAFDTAMVLAGRETGSPHRQQHQKPRESSLQR